jgi:hypothetical protein
LSQRELYRLGLVMTLFFLVVFMGDRHRLDSLWAAADARTLRLRPPGFTAVCCS